MSGGVDSAVAALLLARDGGEAVGVTLELWSDPENDGDASCCSAQAVRGARELAHGLGMAHLSIDLRAEFRAGVVDGWLSDHAAGLTPNPCVRCNGNVRLDAMLELAARLGAQHARHRSLRARARGADARRAAAADGRRRRQGPELRALGARARLARAPALPARRAAQASRSARSPRAPGSAWRAGATRRTSASWPAHVTATSSRATAASVRRPGRSSTRPAPCSASTAARTPSPSASATASASAGASRSTCSPPTPSANTVTVGPREALLARSLRVREADAAPRRRVRRRRARALARAPLRLPRRAASSTPAATSARASSSPSRPSAPRPARSRACTPATWSSATPPSRPERALAQQPEP